MLLMIPGPITMNERVRQAISQPIIGHRTAEYRTMLRSTVKDLQWLLQSESAVPFILASSGTGAIDAAVANTVKPGDHVINIMGGKFGERIAEMTTQYGAKSIQISVAKGNAVDLNVLKSTLEEHPETTIVTFTHNETSTGVLQPAEEISKIVHDHSSAIVIMDAVSNLAGDHIPQDEWNLDIICGGSQKCLGVPPGIGIISVLPSGWKVIEQRQPAPSFYFNLMTMKRTWEKDQDTPWTSAIPLVQALHASLECIKEEGYHTRIMRHQRLSRMIRAGYNALGFSLFANPACLSNTVTSLNLPLGLDLKKFRSTMASRGVAISGSQYPDIPFIRVASMGDTIERDVLTTLAVTPLAMKDLNVNPEDPGAGIIAAINELTR